MTNDALEAAIVAFARALPLAQVNDAARVIDHAPDPGAARPLVLALVPTSPVNRAGRRGVSAGPTSSFDVYSSEPNRSLAL